MAGLKWMGIIGNCSKACCWSAVTCSMDGVVHKSLKSNSGANVLDTGLREY
jgi:hypothetical protein